MHTLTYFSPKSYPAATYWTALFLLGFVIVCIQESSWMPIPFLILGLSMVLARKGVQLDPSLQKIKHFTEIAFVWKIGKWIPMDEYKDVIVLRKKHKSSFGGDLQAPDLSVGEYRYDVFLANNNHLRRLYLYSSFSKTEAYKEARKVATEMEIEFVRYNPAKRHPRKVL